MRKYGPFRPYEFSPLFKNITLSFSACRIEIIFMYFSVLFCHIYIFYWGSERKAELIKGRMTQKVKYCKIIKADYL